MIKHPLLKVRYLFNALDKKTGLYLIMALMTAAQAFAQTGRLSGKVVQESGEAIPGANVSLASSNIGTVTNPGGRFTLKDIPVGTYLLNVSFVGFETQTQQVEIRSGEATKVEISLKENVLALDGLVVTAQKRRQVVQEVPIAMTTFDGSFLQETNIYEFDAFSDYVPGLQVQIQSVNNPGFVIRGITSDNGDARIEPRVSVFQDGVSISKSRGSVVEMYDMERVEVLKGPQGTLFGRGAQIGAIHLIQNKAKNETSGELRLGYGNFNQQLLNGYFNTPLVEDKLFFRLAGIINRRDGFIENLSGGKLNGKSTQAARASLRYLPGQNTVVDLIVNYQYDNPPGTSFKSGTYAPAGGDTSPFTFADLERGEELGLDRSVWGSTLLVNHAISSFWNLTSITAYREFDSYESFDADGTVAPALWFAEDAQGKQFSQEMRLVYNNASNFSGFGGVNFFWEDGFQRVPFETDERSLFALFNPAIRASIQADQNLSETNKQLLLNFVPAVPLVNAEGQAVLIPNLPFIPILQNIPLFSGNELKPFHRETQTNFGSNYAFEIFADGTYALTQQLDITLGVRGTFENITGAIEVENAETPGNLSFVLGNDPNNIFPVTNGRVSHTETFLSAVGRIALEYEASDLLNLFGSISRGRRPNVIQVLGTEVDVLSDEKVWSYELGAKMLTNDNRLQWDINGFYYDYRDFQTQIIEINDDGLALFETRDVGNATALGLETALQWVVARPLQLFANYGYIDARFDDTDSEGNEQGLAGNTFRLTPEHSGSMGLNLELPLAAWGSFFLRPTYNYKSRVFFEEENQPDISQDGYGLLNLRTGLRFLDNKYEAAFYANNLLNEEYLIDAGNTGNAFGIPTFIAGPPRLLGVQLSGRF
ncbi:MAG: TonB-dependent receptor [Cyclobacteriaceae bacterium]